MERKGGARLGDRAVSQRLGRCRAETSFKKAVRGDSTGAHEVDPKGDPRGGPRYLHSDFLGA